MKTILLPVAIPDGARFIAQDSDGWWWAYADKPVPHRRGDGVPWWAPGEGDHSKPIRLALGPPNPAWRDTLRVVGNDE